MKTQLELINLIMEGVCTAKEKELEGMALLRFQSSLMEDLTFAEIYPMFRPVAQDEAPPMLRMLINNLLCQSDEREISLYDVFHYFHTLLGESEKI